MKDNQEQNKEKKVTKFIDRANEYGVTKKTLYSLLSILCVIALIIIISIANAGFNADEIKKISFWVNYALLCGICIYGMISGQQIGDDISRNNKKGAFRSALGKYAIVYKNLEDKKYLPYVDDWLMFFKIRKVKRKMENFLNDYGIYQPEVLNLTKDELPNLLKAWKKDWSNTPFAGQYENDVTYFLSYTEEQIEAIKYCLDGNIKVAPLSKSFFVNPLNQSTKDMWESAAKSEKKKGAYMGLNYVYKIVMLLVMSFVLTGLDAGLKGNATVKSVCLDLISRIAQMITATVWGVFIGCEIVKIDVEYLSFKEDVLKQCVDEIDNQVFIPKKLEEKAMEEYILQQKETVKEVTLENERKDANELDGRAERESIGEVIETAEREDDAQAVLD